MISKLNKALASYKSFSNEHYKILDTSFEWNVTEYRGMGYAEGVVQDRAKIESGEMIQVNGPSKFYLCNENGYWNIFYFFFQDFNGEHSWRFLAKAISKTRREAYTIS